MSWPVRGTCAISATGRPCSVYGLAGEQCKTTLGCGPLNVQLKVNILSRQDIRPNSAVEWIPMLETDRLAGQGVWL